MIIIPQVWAQQHRPLPEGWWERNAPGLVRYAPEVPQIVRETCEAVGVDERLIVTRMQLEQSALTYAWDGTTRDYGGGAEGDRQKLRYLLGVDRTDGGDRDGGWFGPQRQVLGCALRFRYWYRGRDGPEPGWENWMGLAEDPRFSAGVPVTRGGLTISPANQASADCLRYTTSMPAQHRLREIGKRYFAEDYDAEEEAGPVNLDDRARPSVQEVSLEAAERHIRNYPAMSAIRRIIIHHTAVPDAQAYYERGPQRTVDGILAAHLRIGKIDCGYHWMLGPDGRGFICRPMRIAGAHTFGHNTATIGLSFIANFNIDQPGDHDGMEPGQRLVVALLERYDLRPADIVFHRHLAATACPGSNLRSASFIAGVQAIAQGYDEPPKAVLLPGWERHVEARNIDGVLHVPLREWEQGVRGNLVEWNAEQQKAYVSDREETDTCTD